MYFIQLAQGVAYLHAHLICHLDLSLENMLMDENDVCKVGFKTATQHESSERAPQPCVCSGGEVASSLN